MMNTKTPFSGICSWGNTDHPKGYHERKFNFRKEKTVLLVSGRACMGKTS